jgi:hypothetical protein
VVPLPDLLRPDRPVDLPRIMLAGLPEHRQQHDCAIGPAPIRYPGRRHCALRCARGAGRPGAGKCDERADCRLSHHGEQPHPQQLPRARPNEYLLRLGSLVLARDGHRSSIWAAVHTFTIRVGDDALGRGRRTDCYVIASAAMACAARRQPGDAEEGDVPDDFGVELRCAPMWTRSVRWPRCRIRLGVTPCPALPGALVVPAGVPGCVRAGGRGGDREQRAVAG